LGKQLKKAKAVSRYLLASVHQQSAMSALERDPDALGVENFHVAVTSATQTTSISQRISQNPSPIDVIRA